jgi:hypothetical protein
MKRQSKEITKKGVRFQKNQENLLAWRETVIILKVIIG